MNFKIPSLEKDNFFNNIKLDYDNKNIRTYDDYLQYILPTLIDVILPLVKVDQINNLFKIVDKIGIGQYGTVYKGQYKFNNKIYAIKKIRKLNSYRGMNQILRQISLWKKYDWYNSFSNDEINMILNMIKIVWEIVILKKLQIDPVYTIDFHYCIDFNENTNIWLIYEYCNLGELQWKRLNKKDVLQQWLDFTQNEKLTVDEFVFDVFWQLSNALLFLKKNGIIHRDIKPSNILLNGNTKLLKLSDFGCSILTTTDPVFQFDKMDKEQKTHTNDLFQKELNKIVGTPVFLAPEYCQFDQSKQLFNIIDGFKTDLWSLGITMYCLLYNDLPFCGDNEFDTYSKIVSVSLKDKMNDDKVNNLIINEVLEKDSSLRIDIKTLVKKLSKMKEAQKSATSNITVNASYQRKNKSKNSMKKIFNLFKKNKPEKTKTVKQQIPLSTPDNTDQVSLASMETKSFSGESLTPSYTDVRKISSPFSFPESTQESSLEIKKANILNTEVDNNDCESVISKDYSSLVNDGKNDVNFTEDVNLSVGPRLTDTKTPSPVKLEQNNSNSKSSSSFEILTPIRKLIRVKNSPNKPTGSAQTLKSHKENKKTDNKNKKSTLPSSRNIINFRNLKESREAQSNIDKFKNSPKETTEEIKEYLSFADDK